MNLALLIGLGMPELLVILVIVVLIFGGPRIPQVMRGLGLGIKEFKSAVKDDDKDEPKPEKKEATADDVPTELKSKEHD